MCSDVKTSVKPKAKVPAIWSRILTNFPLHANSAKFYRPFKQCSTMRVFRKIWQAGFITISLLTLVVPAYILWSMFQCDFEEAEILTLTPQGKWIKKFDESVQVAPFADLIKVRSLLFSFISPRKFPSGEKCYIFLSTFSAIYCTIFSAVPTVQSTKGITVPASSPVRATARPPVWSEVTKTGLHKSNWITPQEHCRTVLKHKIDSLIV